MSAPVEPRGALFDDLARKLQERADGASLGAARCRSDGDFDALSYYNGQQDAYLDVLTQVRSLIADEGWAA